ncbi:hypothetical protein AB0L75_35380 [Streptomyces sp. NPDC052101]|uniref:hypothetical protein n=1 Tax=Streptomyces sp. NPDC052101 TaxID=3155763 RepID=UPI003418FC30
MPRGKIQMWDRTQGKIRNDEGGPELDFTIGDLLNPSEARRLQKGDPVEFHFDGEQERHAVAVEKA